MSYLIEICKTFINVYNCIIFIFQCIPEQRTYGIVKWFSLDKGYGFITVSNTMEDVFVYKASVTLIKLIKTLILILALLLVLPGCLVACFLGAFF